MRPLLALLGAGALAASEPLVRVDLVADAASTRAGATVTVGVRLRMAPGWHVYWHNPGDSGLAVSVDWQVPAGARVGDLRWPVPTRFAGAGMATYGYAGEAVLLAEITLPPALPAEGAVLAADVAWLACQEACIPGRQRATLTLPPGDGAPGDGAATIAGARAALPAPADPAVLDVASANLVGDGASRRLELRFRGAAPRDLLPPAIPGWVVDHGAIRVADGAAAIPLAAAGATGVPALRALAILADGAREIVIPAIP